MDGFLHQLLAGVASGGIYASVALALAMIFQATRHVNFAQGGMATFSTYVALALIGAGTGYWTAFALTVALSFCAGAAIQRVLLTPLAESPALASVGVFIGLLLVFDGAAGWLFGHTIRQFPSPFGGPFGGPPILGGVVTRHDLGASGVTLAMLLVVWAFFRFTRLGLAMRAAAYNPEAARLMGIRVGAMLALGWGLAAAIGAVSGMMIAPVVFLDPNMMSGVLLYAFAGALLGGIGNPVGAVAGGLAVGIVETLAGTYLVGNEVRLTLALTIIVGVLMVKPSGVFGRTVASRV